MTDKPATRTQGVPIPTWQHEGFHRPTPSSTGENCLNNHF